MYPIRRKAGSGANGRETRSSPWLSGKGVLSGGFKLVTKALRPGTIAS
jgi:hypothetical protein